MRPHTHDYHRIPLLAAVVLGLLAPGPATTGETNSPPAAPTPTSTLKHRSLWYLPNRILDLIDIFRAQVRVGPGLALNIRFTSWANFYAGQYHAVYLGLPGPRETPTWPIPVGFEHEKGLSLLGVDATDTLPHEPVYSDTEFTAGAHLLLVGAEAGFDPVEAADFFLGFFMIDPQRDDH